MPRNPVIHGDLVSAEDFSVEELRQVLFEGSNLLPKTVAVSLLARKDYPGKVNDISQLMQDSKQDVRTRYAAAIALGRIGSPEALSTLRQSEDEPDLYVRRGIRQALERSPSVTAGAEEKEAPERRKGGTWGDRLESYRQGRPGMEFTLPRAEQLLKVDAERAMTVEARRAEEGEIASALSYLAPNVGSAALASERASFMRCAGRDLMVLFERPLIEMKSIEGLQERKTAAALVAVRYGIETQAWSPKYHVLTQPGRGKGEVQVLLVTQRGRVAFAGRARLQAKRAAFSLQSVDAPGAVAAEIDGYFEDGELHFERIRSEQTGRKKLSPGLRRRAD